jgi:hypothetical protein
MGMTMAKRRSGNAVVRLRYDDIGNYETRVAVEGRNVWTGTLHPPMAGFGPGIAYDSPEAYDQTARAALAFAIDEKTDDVQPDYETVEKCDRIAIQRVS